MLTNFFVRFLQPRDRSPEAGIVFSQEDSTRISALHEPLEPFDQYPTLFVHDRVTLLRC